MSHFVLDFSVQRYTLLEYSKNLFRYETSDSKIEVIL